MAGGCFSTVTVFIRNNNDNYKMKKENKQSSYLSSTWRYLDASRQAVGLCHTGYRGSEGVYRPLIKGSFLNRHHVWATWGHHCFYLLPF